MPQQSKSGRQTFKRFERALNAVSAALKFVPKPVVSALFSYARFWPGSLGLAARYLLLKRLAAKCGSNVTVQPGAFLLNVTGLELGSNISIHPMCYIDSFGGCTIEDNVSVAHGVTIMTSSHQFELSDIPIKYQEIKRARVVIESDVWIGAKAVILAGVVVSTGSVVGACSLVNKAVPPRAIVGGIPARVIGTR